MSPAISLTVLTLQQLGENRPLNQTCSEFFFLVVRSSVDVLTSNTFQTLDCVHVVSRGMHFNPVAPITDIMLLVVFFLGGVRLFCRVGFFAASGKTAYLNDRHR